MPEFSCHSCGFSKNVSEKYSGKRVKCPKCDSVSRVNLATEESVSVNLKTTNCEDCGGIVSLRAPSCPHCGCLRTPIEQSVKSDQENYSTDLGPKSVVQLDTAKFLVTGRTQSEVFESLRRGAGKYHNVAAAFPASGIIRGTGSSGVSFVISTFDDANGIVFTIDGETPDGPSNFGVLFDPTEVEGWGVFGATQIFNSLVNSSASNNVSEDIALLYYSLLDSFDATHILDQTVGTGTDTVVIFKRLSKSTGGFHKVVISINGNVIAQLRNGEEVRRIVEPGLQNIELKGGGLSRSLEVELDKASETTFELYFSSLGILGGGIVLKQVSEEHLKNKEREGLPKRQIVLWMLLFALACFAAAYLIDLFK